MLVYVGHDRPLHREHSGWLLLEHGGRRALVGSSSVPSPRLLRRGFFVPRFRSSRTQCRHDWALGRCCAAPAVLDAGAARGDALWLVGGREVTNGLFRSAMVIDGAPERSSRRCERGQVAVTGGAGFIGSTLGDRCSNAATTCWSSTICRRANDQLTPRASPSRSRPTPRRSPALHDAKSSHTPLGARAALRRGSRRDHMANAPVAKRFKAPSMPACDVLVLVLVLARRQPTRADRGHAAPP